MTRDDFLTWRENPVTKWVFEALTHSAERQREHWVETSWEKGMSSPELLAELRVRADAYRALMDTTYEGFCEVLGTEPKE